MFLLQLERTWFRLSCHQVQQIYDTDVIFFYIRSLGVIYYQLEIED